MVSEGEKRGLIILMKRCVEAMGVPLRREAAATDETEPST
jgi:hypothetical protein